MGHFSKNIAQTQEYKKRFSDINLINTELNKTEQQYHDCGRKLEEYKRLHSDLEDKESHLKSLSLDSTQEKKSIANM